MELFSEMDVGEPTLMQLRAERDRLLKLLPKAAEKAEFEIDNKTAEEAIERACRGDVFMFRRAFLIARECPNCGQETDEQEWVSNHHEQFYNICSRIKTLELAEYQKAMEAR